MIEIFYILLILMISILVLLKVKNNLYKVFILFLILIPVIPIVILISEIRRVEYRKEFIRKLEISDNYKIRVDNCKLDNNNILISQLKEVKSFVQNRKVPNNPIKLELESINEKIEIIIASDAGIKEQLWVFYRGKLIGTFESKEAYNVIYNGNCIKYFKYTELPESPY